MNAPNIKFVFFGTPNFAVSFLSELEKKGPRPSLVVTMPDRPKGRKMIPTPPPVKTWAEERGIPVLQPEKLDSEFIYKLRTINYKLFLVAAYGKIMPKEIIDIPKHGSINIHPSLLPRLRGASPIESLILNNEKPAGVSIMLMNEKMDEGPILAQEKLAIAKWPSAPELSNTLARLGARLFVKISPDWISGDLKPEEQDHSKATYCRKIRKEDGLIDPLGDSEENWRKFLAYQPWPGIYFFHGKMRVKITAAELLNTECLTSRFVIKKVIPEGRKEISYEDFKHGVGRNSKF